MAQITKANPDGSVVVKFEPAETEVIHIKMTPEMQAMLDEARAYWKELETAGTPYWCIHKDRGVDHPRAEWKEDGFTRPDGKQMQYKHGVICLDCRGYIQEG